MQQIGIPFTQNGANRLDADPGGSTPLPDASAETPAVLTTAERTQDTPPPAITVETPAQEEITATLSIPPTEELLLTETPPPAVTETPTNFVPVEAGTSIALLPWVQTLDKMCSPLEGVRLEELSSIVSSPYNPPPAGSDARHTGVDFAYYRRDGQESIDGKAVYAFLPGKVVSVVNNRIPFGNVVIIETRYSDVARGLADALGITQERSLYQFYAHMKFSPPVVLGQRVSCGFLIGNVGKTATQMPHLHFETRWGPVGGWFPSMGFMEKDTTEEEKANYLYWRISGVYQHFDPFDLITAYLNFIQQKK